MKIKSFSVLGNPKPPSKSYNLRSFVPAKKNYKRLQSIYQTKGLLLAALKELSDDCVDALTLDILKALSSLCKPHIVGKGTRSSKGV